MATGTHTATPSADHTTRPEVNIARDPQRLENYKDRVGYLAGPMTGYPDYNYPAFNAVAAAYRAEGFTIINPAERFRGDTSLDRTVYMQSDLHTLLNEVDYLIVLPDWDTSAGALLEVAVAQATGLPVFDNNTRSPILFGDLTVDGSGFLAVSPTAQFMSTLSFGVAPDGDEEEGEDETVGGHECQRCYEYEDEDEEVCEPCREALLDDEDEDGCDERCDLESAYTAGYADGLAEAAEERQAMVDLIGVQTQRIEELLAFSRLIEAQDVPASALGQDRFTEIVKEILTMRAAKRQDYADAGDEFSNMRMCEKFGVSAFLGCLVRMSDKFSRITQLANTPPAVKSESITDTLRDLACYAIIASILREQEDAAAVADPNEDLLF